MISHGITYSSTRPEPLHIYFDADYATFHDRKSLTGTIHVAFGYPIHWLPENQPTISLSTSEAENLSTSGALQETLWLSNLLTDIFSTTPTVTAKLPSTPIHSDNQVAINVAHNEGKTKKRKHIYIKHHYLPHHINNNSVTFTHIPGTRKPADSLAKSLGPILFNSHTSSFITLNNAPSSTPD